LTEALRLVRGQDRLHRGSATARAAASLSPSQGTISIPSRSAFRAVALHDQTGNLDVVPVELLPRRADPRLARNHRLIVRDPPHFG
jgi:hypothetical protein